MNNGACTYLICALKVEVFELELQEVSGFAGWEFLCEIETVPETVGGVDVLVGTVLSRWWCCPGGRDRREECHTGITLSEGYLQLANRQC